VTAEPSPSTSTESERREFGRRKLHRVLEIEWGAATLTGVVRDIGPRGLFVGLEFPLWMGASFAARLMVDPVLKLNCTVRRIEPRVGIAVAFDLLEEDGQERLSMPLASLPKI
jgi:hypothetical protein